MKKNAEFGVQSGSSEEEKNNRLTFVKSLLNSPIPEAEMLQNIGTYIPRQNLARIIFMNELYRKIVDVHGVIMEFGVRWGQNLSLFSNYRGIYEPFNYNRKIIGFDTFEGFPSTHEKDGKRLNANDYSVTTGYKDHLTSVLEYHESESPISHKNKFQLVVGDATKTIYQYIEEHPETIIALAYFDFDIYEPTKICMDAIAERLTKGSILAFDELNCPEFPGETLAVMETIGLRNIALRRSPLNPLISYAVIE